ncbi:hypothetical protein OQA88_5048 [Cercophora sp. LCS_1]
MDTEHQSASSSPIGAADGIGSFVLWPVCFEPMLCTPWDLTSLPRHPLSADYGFASDRPSSGSLEESDTYSSPQDSGNHCPEGGIFSRALAQSSKRLTLDFSPPVMELLDGVLPEIEELVLGGVQEVWRLRHEASRRNDCDCERLILGGNEDSAPDIESAQAVASVDEQRRDRVQYSKGPPALRESKL